MVSRFFFFQTEGLPEGAKPNLQFQLSSPVEEASLSEILDESLDEIPDTMKATFRGAETGQATLTITAKDADIPLGSSEPIDLSLVTTFDAMTPKKEYKGDTSVAIRAEGQSDGEPVCTLFLRIFFEPSSSQKREQLYEKLGEATKRKASVLEVLRDVASRQMTTRGQPTSPSKPAVKAGFLNKTKKEEPSKLQVVLDKVTAFFGPDSMARKLKNYFIFFGTMAFFHFQGHLLALPPPV